MIGGLLGRKKWGNRWGFQEPDNPPVPPITSNIKYGRHYNWYAVSNPLFTPDGWHVPTLAEYQTLYANVGGSNTNSLREIGLDYWDAPNTGADNSTGFNAKAGGYRNSSGVFANMGFGQYLVASDNATWVGVGVFLFMSFPPGFRLTKPYGFSVRFIKDDSTDPVSLTDIEDNVYRTVKIGNQVWLADNWACTKLNDGTPIPNVTDSLEWAALTTGAFCNYNNDINNVFIEPYAFTPINNGRIYNGFAIQHANFAPAGWHVPTNEEWTELIEGLDAGNLKDLNYWDLYDGTSTNSTNFSARGSGCWASYIASFSGISTNGKFYSKTEHFDESDPDNPIFDGIFYAYFERSMAYGLIEQDGATIRNNGHCVRLIKDDSTLVPSLTDIDGNIYPVTKIGNQVWMAANFACTKLNNGTPLTAFATHNDWEITESPGQSAYNFDELNV